MWVVAIIGLFGFWVLSGVSTIAAGVFLGIMAVIFVLLMLNQENDPPN